MFLKLCVKVVNITQNWLARLPRLYNNSSHLRGVQSSSCNEIARNRYERKFVFGSATPQYISGVYKRGRTNNNKHGLQLKYIAKWNYNKGQTVKRYNKGRFEFF